MKVKQFYNKNQFIIESENATYFQSYESTCAKVEGEALTLGSDWNYSATTRKHLYLFLKNYCYNIYKMIVNSNNKSKSIQKLIDKKSIKW